MPNNIEAPKGPNDLFNNGRVKRGEISTSSEIEARALPLGGFSEFILTEQQRLLTEIRAGNLGVDAVIQRQRELLTNLSPETVKRASADPMSASVAILDLTFAINAVVLSGGTPPDEVEQLSARFAQATGLPRTMTFEKIVSINSKLPYQQMRIFTDGEVGATERMFYYGHELMNMKLQETVTIATQSVDALRTKGQQGVDEVVVSLEKGSGNMKEFADFMKGFMKMPREHFSIFRQYLSQYPDGTRNASGAFIGMPRLNIRLVGLSPKYEQFLDEGMQYFPINEQSDIQYARRQAKQGDYLVAQCERLQGEQQQNLAKTLIRIIEPIRDFRLGHLAAVVRYVSQALPEGVRDLKVQLAQTEEEPILDDESTIVKGTAGFLPGPLLRNTLRMDLRALERLSTIINM